MRPLVTLLLLAACAPTSTTAPLVELPPQSVDVAGRVLLSISDPAADEGLFWDIAVSGDGRFVGENTWSDGADSFRSDCGGQRTSAEVRGRFKEVRSRATLSTAPGRVGPRDFEQLEITVAFQDPDGTVLYVPADELDDETRAWAETFVGDCL